MAIIVLFITLLFAAEMVIDKRIWVPTVMESRREFCGHGKLQISHGILEKYEVLEK